MGRFRGVRGFRWEIVIGELDVSERVEDGEDEFECDVLLEVVVVVDWYFSMFSISNPYALPVPPLK